MTTTTTQIPTPGSPAVGSSPSGGRLYWAIADMWTMTKRNLIGYTWVPEAVFFSSVQPIMFVLLFRYVFGGAIPTPGYHYVQFLMPGIFVQTVAFGSIGTSIGLAEDLQKGLIERFRALPMSRWAVLAGRTTADLFRNLFVMALMTAVGYAVGYRIGTNVGEYLGGILLLLLVRLCPQLGVRVRRPLRPQQRNGAVDVVPRAVPAHLRFLRLRPVADDAGLVAGLRQASAGVGRLQRGARPHVGRCRSRTLCSRPSRRSSAMARRAPLSSGRLCGRSESSRFWHRSRSADTGAERSDHSATTQGPRRHSVPAGRAFAYDDQARAGALLADPAIGDL